MNISLKTADPSEIRTPALVVFLFSEDDADLGGRPDLGGLKPVIGPRLKAGDFKADYLNTLTLFPGASSGPERIILVGLGPEKKYGREKLRSASAKGAQSARDFGVSEAALALPPGRAGLEAADAAAEAVVLGARLGLYDYSELKTKNNDKKKKPLKSLTVVRADRAGRAKIQAAMEAAEATADAVVFVRDLVNRPSNLLYPETLAQEATALAKADGLKIKVLDIAEARRRGMGAFLGVAQGSARPGRMLVLEYRGAGAKDRPLALIGKAITFDSGGLNLKPGESMSHMKTDMAGGAAVLGVLRGAARLKLKVNLVGIIPATENMPDGGAYRPGDVLTSMSGQTIEVTNTDAEGRLILADALTLAQQYKPWAMIDLATLTGACVVALGEKCAGLMGTDADLIAGIKAAAGSSGEMVWELPLIEDYFESLKSGVADFKNSSLSRYAGTITGALFLKQFVGDMPWAHLDFAGPARADKPTPETPAGGTGFGVNLLLHYLRRL